MDEFRCRWHPKTEEQIPEEQVPSIGEFWDKIQDMADETFGVDDDGDSNVGIKVWDYTEHEPMSYLMIPHLHKAKNKGEAIKIFDLLLSNSRIANEQLERFIKLYNLDMIKELKGEE